MTKDSIKPKAKSLNTEYSILNTKTEHKKNKLHKQWLWKASWGLMFTGAGLCFFGEALHWKYVPDAPLWKWIAWGSLSMVVFHAGLCMVVQAAIHRVHFELLKEKDEDSKKGDL